LRVAELLSKRLGVPTGYTVAVRKVESFSPGNIHIQYSSVNKKKKEAYELKVNDSEILLSADSAAGIFYGVQTLIQLFPKQVESKKEIKDFAWTVPAVSIEDSPRFWWRGSMLDVARHFFTKQQVKEFIDNMVKYKFNVLHLHLADDQGWRLEIKSLPKLTDVGAWRPERKGKWGNTPRPSPNEPKTYGGFYTQEDMKELIAYAKDRFVEILPEIDVPGHSLAAIASYPELSCTDSFYQVNIGDKIIDWSQKGFPSLLDNTLCPANEKVYVFLDKVFTEVAELFPFGYIHMGGDETSKNFWMKSPQIKSLMKEKGFTTMSEVFGYFVGRTAKIVQSKGKKVIGWDEATDATLPEGMIIMDWKGLKGGSKAAKQGHQVVMSPTTFAYYDLYQGDPVAEPPTYSMLRLSQSYKFDPLPEGVDEKLILGGQGNIWTEQIQNVRALQYMMYPRVFAIAESVWSQQRSKDWKTFIKKVENEFERMDVAEIKYSRSMYDPIFKSYTDGDNLILDMQTEIEDLKIHYSFDGSFPDNFYPEYTKPLIIPKDVADVRVITYRNGKQTGKLITMPVSELQKRAKKK
ncbi:MAG: family 20 glycosylhydrolase, partial [Chitinophagaceae bacterium]|nr:family 20 glycosylhydrolase [Chitinophagaceae bacterium]